MLPRKWIRPQLKLEHFTCGSFSTLHMKRSARTDGSPEPAPFPAGVGIVDPAVHPFGIETQRVRHTQFYPLTVFQREQSFRFVAGIDGNIFAQSQRIELIDPCIIARLGTAGSVDTSQLR
jgi:hypothetical protein